MVFRSSIVAAAVLCLSAGAFAQGTSKIGIISMQGAIIGTKDGQKAQAELQAKFEPKKKEFDQRNTEIQQMEDQLRKGGTLMSDEKRTQMERDIDEKKRRLERDVQDAREEMQQAQNAALTSLVQRLQAVVEKYAKDNGYTMILDVSNPNSDVLYSATGVDITQDIVALYDKTTVNGAPAVKPGATPGTTGTGAGR